MENTTIPVTLTPLERECLVLIQRMEQQLRLFNEDFKLNGTQRIIDESKELIEKLKNKNNG